MGLKKEKKKEVHQERAVSAGTRNSSFTQILNGKKLDLLQWNWVYETRDVSFLNSLETLLTNEIVWKLVLVCNFSCNGI